MTEPNHYELLGVEPSATQAEIKSAFRQQALRNHPDQGGNPVLFRLIEQAYETLISPSRREQYDRSRAQSFAGSGSHFDNLDDVDQADEPTRQWSADDWNSRAWAGEDSPSWNSREPDETPPTYVHGEDPDFIKNRPGLPWGWHRWVFWGVMAWVFIALVFGLPAVPGFTNTEVLQLAIFAALVWIFGSFLMRIGGFLLAGWTIWQNYINDPSAIWSITMFGLAFGMWLGGHWFFMVKRGEPRSFIAHKIFESFPGFLHPLHRWETIREP